MKKVCERQGVGGGASTRCAVLGVPASSPRAANACTLHSLLESVGPEDDLAGREVLVSPGNALRSRDRHSLLQSEAGGRWGMERTEGQKVSERAQAGMRPHARQTRSLSQRNKRKLQRAISTHALVGFDEQGDRIQWRVCAHTKCIYYEEYCAVVGVRIPRSTSAFPLSRYL